MKKRFWVNAAAIFACGIASPAMAQSQGFAATVDYAAVFGLGLAGSYAVIPDTFNARLQFRPGQSYSSSTKTKDGFDITPSVKFGNLGAYADWFPFQNGFRLTGGLASFSNTKLEVSGTKSNATTFSATTSGGNTFISSPTKTYTVKDGTTYTQGNTTYSITGGILTTTVAGGATSTNNLTTGNTLNTATAGLGVDAKVKFNSIVPYLGLGYGNPVSANGGWSFFFDFGLFLTGSPKLDVNVRSNCTEGNADVCNYLVQELNAQKDKTIADTKDDLNKIKFLPNLSLGVSYSF